MSILSVTQGSQGCLEIYAIYKLSSPHSHLNKLVDDSDCKINPPKTFFNYTKLFVMSFSKTLLSFYFILSSPYTFYIVILYPNIRLCGLTKMIYDFWNLLFAFIISTESVIILLQTGFIFSFLKDIIV